MDEAAVSDWHWLSELRPLLARENAEDALAAALEHLGVLGVAKAGPDDVVWLDLAHRTRRLPLAASRPIADGTRDLIACLLHPALARAVEQGGLERATERMDLLSAASFEGIMFHVDGVIVDANERLAEMLGYTRDELLGADTLRRCVSPEDLPDVIRRMADRVEGEYVITGIRKNGSRFRAELNGRQGWLGDRPYRVATVRDVTHRERMTTLLKESEARLRDLAEQAFDAIVFHRDGVIVEVGGDTHKVLGRTRDELVGRTILEMVAPSAFAAVSQAMAEQRTGAYRAVATNKAGEPVPVEVVAVNSTFDGEPVRVAGLRDLRESQRLEAERHRLEQRVEQSQRLESLGVLAGGIAHDFNNLLVGVLGNAELLRGKLTEPGDLELAVAIMAAAERAAELTRQMLAYAGKSTLSSPKALDIGAILRELHPLLAATLSKKARVELAIEPSCVIDGDRATITQVLMNLLTNASDALAGQPGTITVRARRIPEADARWAHALGAAVRPGPCVLVEVEDTGTGMDAATRTRVFEPFFTTKDKGHGLGLAACLGIVSTHGGAVFVESELGTGSRFSVLFPASASDQAAPAASTAMRVARPCAVLVVDDEPLIRTQLRRALEQRGYTIDEASDGRSALARLAARPPDAIILDMSMPDLDGAEVLRRIRATGSAVPVLLSSGHIDTSVEARLDPAMYQAYLSKPYTLAELIDALESARAQVATPPSDVSRG